MNPIASAKKQSRWPLRWVLVIPTVLQTMIVVGLVGWLADHSGRKSVERLADHNMDEMGDKIEQYLNSYLQLAQLVNQRNRDALESQLFDKNDFNFLGKLFVLQVKNYGFTYVNYGNEQEQFIGAGYVQGRLVIEEIQANSLLKAYAVDPLGNRLRPPTLWKNQNPTHSHWYWQAVKAQKPVWSPIYNWPDLPDEISIAAISPVYDPQKKLLGVVGIDLGLTQLSQFLQKPKFENPSTIAIIEPSGLLVATSEKTPVYQVIQGKAQRINLKDFKSSVTPAFIQAFDEYQKSPSKHLFRESQDYFIQAVSYRDNYGLDWIILIALPKSYLLSEIQANQQRTVILSILALIGAIALGVITSERIVRPMNQLQNAVQKVAQGDFQPQVLPSSILEIQQLEDAFRAMAQQLNQAFQQQKQLNQEIRQRESLFRRYFEQSLLGIAMTSPDKGWLAANDRLCEILGYNFAELQRMTWEEMTYPDDLAADLEQFNRVMAGKIDGYELDKRFIHREGHTIDVSLSVKCLRQDDGAVDYFVAMIQDISDRKRAEQELQRSNEELLKATRLKDEFLATMSHELRTPLNAILGMAESLQEAIYGPLHPPQIKALQTIEKSAFHLLDLINDILDVAKIEAGEIHLDCHPTPVRSLCQSSLVFVQPQAEKKGLQLLLDCPPGLPDLYVDERRIRQVLINLLNNAVKFTPQGGTVTLTVSLAVETLLTEADPLPTSLRLTVSDTGIGIAPEHLAQIFTPFFQVESTLSRRYEGTGLGLTLVKRIVELHGGTVSVQSTLEKGSHFSLDLPCLMMTDSPLPSSSAMSLDPVFPNPDAPLILLAEDHPSNVITIESYLEAKGYRLIVAENGQEAIALAQTEKPDLILMDIQMPVLDGLSAIRQLRQDPAFQTLPIIALTALAMAGDQEKCLQAGANDYLSKPVRLRELVECIQKWLKKIPKPLDFS